MKVLTAQGDTGKKADKGAIDDAKFAQGKSWVDPIVGAWVSGMSAMESATGSFRQMVLGVFDSIAQTAIQKVGQMATKWIMEHIIMRTVSTAAKAADVATTVGAEAAKTVAVVTGVGVRTTAEVSGAAISKGVTITSALAQIGAHAAVAAAGAYAALAAIPVIGPIIAPLAAAAALIGVLALGKSLFSAEGGWGEVPADGMQATLHKKEMVLPAAIAEPLRQSLKGGFALPTAGGVSAAANEAGGKIRAMMQEKGGDTNLHYNPQITNPDPDLKRLLESQPRVMRRWIDNQYSNGFRPGKPR